MKNRIIAFLSLLFIVFTAGAVISMLYITFTTSELKKIITLHSVEIMRQELIIKIQNVERDLLTVNTELGGGLDKVTSGVSDLGEAVNNCTGCHHSPVVTRKLDDIRGHVGKFEASLRRYLAAHADEERIRALRTESYRIGADLLNITSEMTGLANQRLQERTRKAMDDVRIAQGILVITLLISFLIGLWIAVKLTRNVIGPIRELIGVSRKIASGDLGYTTAYVDSTEFGELASSFNEMSTSLLDSNEKAVRHMSRLAGLYRVTLPFHSVWSIAEIFREVSYRVGELLDVEQCCLLLMGEQDEYLEHKCPALGPGDREVVPIRVRREDMLKLYFSHNRKPLIISDPQGETLPPGLAGEGPGVRNMLLGWVRLKGELFGVIRLVNTKQGDFTEESARLLGIISNNVSVAVENAKLYEDLKAQMRELKETQEQLLQAAKLAAIGELASNVAHEINNPLTCILGYSELIKEETDLENIMKDVEVIEKESARARDIVQQLLEFARRRPLELREVDINSLIREVVSLIGLQFRDEQIRVKEAFSSLPVIMGDSNQLKQVFLNIISNAVHALTGTNGDSAMPDRNKEINIRTGKNETSVFVEIADNGQGISSEALPKIFEPFFTTKREKGTGLGLSITYKIIQSHKGKIDVRSEEGKGAKFTISLPIYMSESAYSHQAR